MQLSFGIVVVLEPFAFQPAQQPPLSGSLPALDSALDRILNRRLRPWRVVEDVIPRFRAFEGKRFVIAVGKLPWNLRAGVTRQVQTRVYGWRRWKAAGVDVIGTPAEIVIRVPGIAGGQYRNLCARR